MPSAKPPVDWEAVWKSLNWDDATKQEHAERERLYRRAQQYAAPLTDKDAVPQDAKAILTFALGQEQYGIEVAYVRGVRAAPEITAIPGTPNFYRGVINLRGQIVTVLDLRYFFGLSVPAESNMADEVVIAQVGRLQLALLAEQINGVVNLPASEIKGVEHLPYAVGITRDRLIVLNLKQIFEDERLVVGTNL